MTHSISLLKHHVSNGAIAHSLAKAAPALAAGLLGAVLLYGIGFAQPSLLHDAAHDSRHSMAFPCH
jgi:cobalt transporter subunit CbtB